jgi:hypothetical protein
MVNLRSRVGAVACLLCLALSGCVAAAPQRDVWICDSDEDCVAGFRCSAVAGEPERRCMPTCRSSLDCNRGQCTSASVCAPVCSFGSDGRPIEACSPGLSCGRLRYPLTTFPESGGLCGLARTCSTDTDCGPASVCMSSSSPMLRGLSHLPCAPAPTGSACPTGWVGTELGCLPNCAPSTAEVSCPPGMACLQGSLVPFGARASEGACYFGFYGAPCRNDTECFVGSCLPVGDGTSQCTETCESAARLSALPPERACGALVNRAGVLGARLVFQCESAELYAPCVARGGVGSGCLAQQPGPDDECAEGLECREGVCTRPCVESWECLLRDDGGNRLANGFCDAESGLCAPLLERGERCELDDACVTKLCAPPSLTGGEPVCAEPRGPSVPCARDAECRSGSCRVTVLLGLCD